MKVSDVKLWAIRAAIADMGDVFATTDVAAHPVMLREHSEWLTDSYYRSRVGRFLSKYREDLHIEQTTPPDRSYASWRKTNQPATKSGRFPSTAAKRPPDRSPSRGHAKVAGNFVRAGHYRCLDYMASSEFLKVKALFESYPEIGGVYFRPTNRGVTVLDLHPDSPNPRIGVGCVKHQGISPYIGAGKTAAALAPSMPQRIEYLRGVRARQRAPWREFQFEARMIREAQGNALRLPRFPRRLRFIHSQWRIDSSKVGVTDLLAVDLPTATLVAIELKESRELSAIEQAADYLDLFTAHGDELYPFFTRVAQVMGQLYGCPELTELDEITGASVPLSAWPDAANEIDVIGLGRLQELAG